MNAITYQPIQLETFLTHRPAPEAGGTVIFLGNIRNHSDDREVVAVEYSVHEAMANKQIAAIIHMAKERWPLEQVEILHRIGKLAVGDCAVVLMVASSHRAEAYEASRYIIDSLKHAVPIWKKEYFVDGSSEWSQGCEAHAPQGGSALTTAAAHHTHDIAETKCAHHHNMPLVEKDANHSHSHHAEKAFVPLQIALLTVSDTRTDSNDSSGKLLQERILDAGHHLAEKCLVQDNVYKIREVVSRWIADENIQVILTTGGTGGTGRDVTPEALEPLLEKTLDGFGELFRWLSYRQIGANAVTSRAIAGIANKTYLFALPGSPNACKLGWDEILKEQLDARTPLCSLAELWPRL